MIGAIEESIPAKHPMSMPVVLYRKQILGEAIFHVTIRLLIVIPFLAVATYQRLQGEFSWLRYLVILAFCVGTLALIVNYIRETASRLRPD
jgi:hypothetical protein